MDPIFICLPLLAILAIFIIIGIIKMIKALIFLGIIIVAFAVGVLWYLGYISI